MARDYVSEFKGHCLTCKKYEISKGDWSWSTVRGFRCKRLQRPMAFDEKCYQYDFDAVRGNRMIEEAVDWRVRRGYDPRPDCYVVTAMCEILGLPMDHEFITNFRILRDEHMINSEAGKSQIAAYDNYGEQLAERLKANFNNPETKESTEKMIRTVLLPSYEQVNELIKFGNLDMAMYVYFQMMGILSRRYGITYSPALEEQKEAHQGYAKVLI
ncbi:MAG: hypothetical protein IJO63_04170 [Bacilli bacterium]|nr:hypothetical protein [Bacilli bacterium]